MRVLVQRVKSARVDVAGEVVAASGHGLLLLVGVEADDGEEDLRWLSGKLTRLRIFDDENGVIISTWSMPGARFSPSVNSRCLPR